MKGWAARRSKGGSTKRRESEEVVLVNHNPIHNYIKVPPPTSNFLDWFVCWLIWSTRFCADRHQINANVKEKENRERELAELVKTPPGP